MPDGEERGTNHWVRMKTPRVDQPARHGQQPLFSVQGVYQICVSRHLYFHSVVAQHGIVVIALESFADDLNSRLGRVRHPSQSSPRGAGWWGTSVDRVHMSHMCSWRAPRFDCTSGFLFSIVFSLSPVRERQRKEGSFLKCNKKGSGCERVVQSCHAHAQKS